MGDRRGLMDPQPYSVREGEGCFVQNQESSADDDFHSPTFDGSRRVCLSD